MITVLDIEQGHMQMFTVELTYILCGKQYVMLDLMMFKMEFTFNTPLLTELLYVYMAFSYSQNSVTYTYSQSLAACTKNIRFCPL